MDFRIILGSKYTGFFTDKPVKVKRINVKYIHSIGIKADQTLKDITFYKIQLDSYIIVAIVPTKLHLSHIV